jgi:hypothetical protein
MPLKSSPNPRVCSSFAICLASPIARGMQLAGTDAHGNILPRSVKSMAWESRHPIKATFPFPFYGNQECDVPLLISVMKSSGPLFPNLCAL